LEQGLHRALEATAPLWPELVIAHGWLDEAAQILANPDGADSATVQARYAVLVADIQQEAAPTPALQRMAAEFTKVTASYGTQVFPCYDVAELPRTNNDLEQVFGGVRHQLRRATGQKKAPASLVVCGATRLPAAVASRTHRFTATELVPTNLERWRAKRTLLKQRRLPRILGRRFRQDPEAYLQKLEERLVKLSLPP
jgi:hypothetical protein